MPFLERKIPPPLVGILYFFVIFFAPGQLSVYVPFAPRLIVGLTIYSLGVALAAAGFLALSKARTTVSPHNLSATALVTTGIYSHTRNPMYLAIIVALFAWCVFLLNPVALLLVFSCMYYLNRYQILPEERALAQRFPESYPVYQARVRRWF